jgi:hypothetical protein
MTTIAPTMHNRILPPTDHECRHAASLAVVVMLPVSTGLAALPFARYHILTSSSLCSGWSPPPFNVFVYYFMLDGATRSQRAELDVRTHSDNHKVSPLVRAGNQRPGSPIRESVLLICSPPGARVRFGPMSRLAMLSLRARDGGGATVDSPLNDCALRARCIRGATPRLLGMSIASSWTGTSSIASRLVYASTLEPNDLLRSIRDTYRRPNTRCPANCDSQLA